jgi:hypothetical protein
VTRTRSRRHRHLRDYELEESAVHFVGVRPADGVRTALDRDEGAIRDQRRQPRGGRVERCSFLLCFES